MIADWSRKWDSPGERIYNKYRELLGRCGEMERRKDLLLKEWNELNGERLDISLRRWRKSSGVSESRDWESNVKARQELWSGVSKNLKSFAIDSVGLYVIRPR
jgi:hypothetical protein